MDTMALIRPTVQPTRCISLTVGAAAAAEARSQVRAAIYAWDVPVDAPVAVLLTSELVTNAIRHEPGETVVLSITCDCGQLRVDVHDTSRSVPVPVDAPADAETGRGLMLVASLSTDWGFYPTPAGKAVYFTLEFQADLDESDKSSPQGDPSCPVNRVPPTHSPDTPCGPRPFPRRHHLDAMARKAASRAMSVREWTSSFFRMWETWVATVRRDRNSLAAISGLDIPPSTSAAILVSAGVRLSQPLRACRCFVCGPRRMP
jgi:anti-sigma regulatory factor (Ser/Thr protein kinase)